MLTPYSLDVNEDRLGPVENPEVVEEYARKANETKENHGEEDLRMTTV
ncbi:MAG: hypothetical protein ABEK59_03740 [Halobacteria archaeon]